MEDLNNFSDIHPLIKELIQKGYTEELSVTAVTETEGQSKISLKKINSKINSIFEHILLSVLF